MKQWKVASIILTGLLLIAATACGTPGKANNQDSRATVKRGDLAVSVAGSGNLATYQDRKLSFGSAGKISELLFKEGDRVKAGDTLARLETDTLEIALTEAQASLSKAELAVTQAEIAVTQEPVTKDKAQMAVTQANLDLKSAENSLDQTAKSSSVSDLRIAQAEADTAQRNLSDSLVFLSGYTPGTQAYLDYQKNVVLAQARLKAAQDKVNAMLNGFSTEEITIKKLQVELARQSLDVAKQLLALELQPREAAKQSLTLAKQNLELARKSVGLAQKRLSDATIVAPFDGLIASVQPKVGDMVDAATTVVYLVNPTRLEVVVEVDEMDIPEVAVGQWAKLKVDAISNKNFVGTVASVYPVPTKVTGLVMYNVKISLMVPEDSGLKIGMRATADINTKEKSAILNVPSRLVKEDGQGGHFVKVITDNKTEKKAVTIGISNATDTEIISGLIEGETVVN